MDIRFDCDGFLSESSPNSEHAITVAYSEIFSSAKAINRFAHDALFSADIRSHDGEAIIISALFMRVLEHYQASIILMSRGAISSARVTIRALMEATFRICSIVKNEGSFREFIAEDMVYRLKQINKTMNNDYPSLEDTKAVITEEFVINLKADIAKFGAKALSTEDLSRNAGMHEWYITVYSLLSKAIHTQVRDIEDYIKSDENGNIMEFVYAPNIIEIPRLIYTATELVAFSALAFDERFKSGIGEKIDVYRVSMARTLGYRD